MTFAQNVGRNLNSNHGQKLLDGTKNSTTDALKTASRAIQKRTEATDDLIGNKIADRITAASQIVKSKLTMPTLVHETSIGAAIEITSKKCIPTRKATASY